MFMRMPDASKEVLPSSQLLKVMLKSTGLPEMAFQQPTRLTK